MRFLTIDEKGGQPGIIVGDDKVLNLAKVPKSLVPGWRPSSIKEIFERGEEGLNAVRRIADTVESAMDACQPALSELMETELCPPVPDPWLVFSVGMNYGRHLAEMNNSPHPKNPSGFIKTRFRDFVIYIKIL